MEKANSYTGSVRIRYALIFAVMTALTLLLVALNIVTGSVDIPLKDVVRLFISGRGTDGGLYGTLGANEVYSTYASIIWDIRFPRALSAMILGGALSLAGYQLQSFFHNPIAGPFILGISSGSKLMVALLMVFGFGLMRQGGSVSLVIAALAGAILSMGFILLISGTVGNMSALVVCGVMIGYICSAVTDFVVTFAADADIVNLHNWSRGSFSGSGWSGVKVSAVTIAIVLILSIYIAKPLGAYALGEEYALGVGINVKRLRALLVLLSSLAAAIVVAYAGPISFVGVAVPHLCKRIFASSRPIVLIPGCFLGGAIFCLVCDMIARVAFAPTELSISTVTAVFGAPVVIWVLIDRHRRGYIRSVRHGGLR